ncbi:MAG TPA: hypothetical protein DD979_16415 [Gammaproteobacteria bacterium]|nr:hypothetical protein [Gammaproteobacteria bacterium]
MEANQNETCPSQYEPIYKQWQNPQSMLAALDAAQAIIEFDVDGNIVDANENFLATTGYQLEEIVGQHHRMFCEPDYADSPEYERFWETLRTGEHLTGVYMRLAKDGSDVWINASYNPIFSDGEIIGVVKFATDVTEQKRRDADYESKVKAIDGAQAVIEFDLTGHIITANQNFLAATGYTLKEIRGKHHRIFCEPAYAKS